MSLPLSSEPSYSNLCSLLCLDVHLTFLAADARYAEALKKLQLTLRYHLEQFCFALLAFHLHP